MKIAISGAQCTGKTTLMNQIKEAGELFEDYQIISEVVRTIKKRKGEDFEFNKSGDFESQELILSEHHRNAFKYPNYVTDRCAWDAFTYATKNYLDGLFTFKEWKLFETIFIETIRMYDVIIYLPTGMIDMESDGVRSTDVEYQKEIDELFQKIAKTYGLEYVLLNDPLEERFDIFKGLLFPELCGCSDENCTHE